MEAKMFRHKQREEKEKEESMPEESYGQHQEQHQEPQVLDVKKKPEAPKPPDPLQGLSEEEALSYAMALPHAATSASAMASEFHITLSQMIQVKKITGQKLPDPATQEQIVKIKKKVHMYRVAHGLEQLTQEEQNEAAQVSSGQ